MTGDGTTDEDYKKRLTHLHYQFVASAKAVKLGHEIDSEKLDVCLQEQSHIHIHVIQKIYY